MSSLNSDRSARGPRREALSHGREPARSTGSGCSRRTPAASASVLVFRHFPQMSASNRVRPLNVLQRNCLTISGRSPGILTSLTIRSGDREAPCRTGAAVRGNSHVKSLELQEVLHDRRDRGIVFDDQNPAATGRSRGDRCSGRWLLGGGRTGAATSCSGSAASAATEALFERGQSPVRPWQCRLRKAFACLPPCSITMADRTPGSRSARYSSLIDSTRESQVGPSNRNLRTRRALPGIHFRRRAA